MARKNACALGPRKTQGWLAVTLAAFSKERGEVLRRL